MVANAAAAAAWLPLLQVAMMRAFGAWFDLSHSFVGMVFIGIGNGANDVVCAFLYRAFCVGLLQFTQASM